MAYPLQIFCDISDCAGGRIRLKLRTGSRTNHDLVRAIQIVVRRGDERIRFSAHMGGLVVQIPSGAIGIFTTYHGTGYLLKHKSNMDAEGFSLMDQLQLQTYDFDLHVRSSKLIEFDSCLGKLLNDNVLDLKSFAAVDQDKFVELFEIFPELPQNLQFWSKEKVDAQRQQKFVESVKHHINELKDLVSIDEIYAYRKSLANCEFIKWESDFDEIFNRLKEKWTNVSDDVLKIALQVLSNNTLYPLHLKVGALRAISNKHHGDDVIGIDLGTKNARVAVMLGAVPTVIETVSGHTTPSLVAVDGVKGILVGEAAKSHPNLLYRMRDLIGRRYDDPQTQKLKSMVPFNIYGDENGNSLVEVNNKYFSVTEVCSFILDEMKKTAELYLGRTISTAVISVPSDFSDSQRREMELAGNKVGLKEIHLVKEPVAAIISSKRQNGVFITFTMGAGKFDVSVFEVRDGVIEVKAQCGDRSLGGDDFDVVLANHLAEEIKRVHDVDLTSDRTAMTRLKEAAEEAKIRLSHFSKTLVRGYFWSGRGPVNVNIAISRSKFEGLVDDMIQKARTLCDKCLKDAKTNGVYEIDEVFLVGGMTRVPAVQKIVQEIFKQSPSTDFKPEEAVVLGATFYGALKREENNILLPGSLPLSIGVETWGATFTKIVPRNSKLPAKGSQTFTTEYDNQGSLVFRILYGEGWSTNSSATKFLGELELKGIPPYPQGLPRVELTFEIDEAGNLCASAKLGGVERLVSIQVPLDLSHEYVWKLVRSAILNGPTEIQQYRLAKLRLKSSTLIYRLGSSLSRKEEKIQEQLRSEAHSTIMELKALIGSQDVYQLTKKMYDVMQLNREIILEAFQDESDDDDRDGYCGG